MRNIADYRAKSVAAGVRADGATSLAEHAHHTADAASWEALAKMAERHAVTMAAFRV
ncbi:MAG: hypothetical protein Q7J13_08875 [Brevundimonas sp.]|uniref:hypothetical protein n=1 Tax=Brevundimonas sp. TaxID=1871086 RepID=UPI002722C34B|nr:hypothetical protein [Brevundimonas sp.]MDO9588036.1 hypothetical protein [Brevundimonas sp.]